MTLPASGTLTLLEVQTEFGGPGNLTAYYRGGAYVANTSNNASIPTSGVIRLQQFYGASNAVVSYSMTAGTSNSGYVGLITAAGAKEIQGTGSTGFSTAGSISPANYQTYPIDILATINAAGTNTLYLTIRNTASQTVPPAAGVFTKLTIVNSGAVYYATGNSTGNNANTSNWAWATSSASFASGSSYTIKLQ